MDNDYVELDDEHNSGSFSGEVSRAIERHNPGKIDVVRPSEWRVDQIVQEWPEKFGLSVRILTDDRYLCSLARFQRLGRRKKTTDDGTFLSHNEEEDKPFGIRPRKPAGGSGI